MWVAAAARMIVDVGRGNDLHYVCRWWHISNKLRTFETETVHYIAERPAMPTATPFSPHPIADFSKA